tara:strand:+ start:193 stop:762 length:570 start_codon:yes stop_codon:yes gene_type:complete
MKKILLILVLGLVLASNAFAKDLNQFEMEGVKFGDQLTNYADETLIKDTIAYNYKNDKFSTSRFTIQSENFYYLEISYDKNYLIVGLMGVDLLDNMDQCETKKNNILDKYSQLLTKAKKKESREKHPADKTGKSLIFGEVYTFKNGDRVQVSCTDWSKKIESETQYRDKIEIYVHTRELAVWQKKNIIY